MSANQSAQEPASGSDLARIDAHEIQPEEYIEIPELTDEMLARGTLSKDGVDLPMVPCEEVTLYLPVEVISRWKVTGSGWLARMAERLSDIS